ncbi:MAG TPA: hypothetical protein VD788_05055 [Candidatus Polarisedimenticolaceae bacterium]|nr:hypothetical protein [Candidatus Polarisedimenticolaceae bacterium]
MLVDLLRDPAFWQYASIPFVAAFIGWITNWVAIQLTFRPLAYVGWRPPFGWQGIIPAKASKMARIFVDRTMFRLGTLREVYQSMDPEKMAQHVTAVMDPRIEEYTNELMFYEDPRLWQMLPDRVKRGIYARVREELPRLVRALIRDAGEQIDELIDLKEMLVQRLEGDRGLLNRLFLQSGKVEFAFIIRSGLYFGFLFGLIQLAVWWYYKGWWVLPVFGVIVGYATNWFALNIIFRPLHPIRVGPWRVQGLFLKRQREVAAVWCEIVTTEILTVQQMIYAMLYGSKSANTHALIRRHIGPVVDAAVESYRPLSDLAVGERTLDGLRSSVAAKAIAVSTDPFDHWQFNRERARVIDRLLRERMESMPPDQFQELLRPCFQEDEFKLILTGAVLGFVAGWAQLVLVFGGAG